ncbi:MAG: hypothetical protein ACRDPK_15655 [Carbonactinosporaceae bacterium]
MRIRVPLLVAAALALAFPGASAYAESGSAESSSYVELKAPQPGWYTPELHQKVLAAAARGEGVPLPEGTEYEASGLAFTGIRPGAWMISPAGCTLNFVFGGPGDYFIGTAGHCAKVGEQVTIIAAPGILMNIGRTVKSVDNGIGNDFSLIDVRPAMEQHVNPSMAYFGGPTAAGSPKVTDIVEHAGHGLVIGTGGTPRAGVVAFRGRGDTGGSDAFAWVGAASPGDSGSPVRLSSGQAAGDLTHLVVGGKYVPSDVAGTTIARMLEIAGKPLATAPNVPDPTS